MKYNTCKQRALELVMYHKFTQTTLVLRSAIRYYIVSHNNIKINLCANFNIFRQLQKGLKHKALYLPGNGREPKN